MTTPIKLAIVLHDLRGGGAEKMMVRLANELAEGGDHIDLVLLTERGVTEKHVSSKVNIIDLNAPRTMTSVPRLVKYLKQSRPDRVLSALTHVNVIATIACLLTGMLKQLHTSERNAFSRDKLVNSDLSVKLAYFLAPYFYRWQPNPVIAVSQGVADELVRDTVVRESDTVTAPNPVLDNNFVDKQYSDSQHPWLANRHKPIIVAVGRLAEQKGFDVLIDAMAMVRKQMDCCLIIFGEGEDRAKLEDQVKQLQLGNNVDLPGYSSDVLTEMANADLFVLSSRFEGSPNVLVEAMSTGVAVIATDCPYGPDEILDGGQIGPLTKMENAENLAGAIVEQLSQEDTKRSLRLARAQTYTSQNASVRYRHLIVEAIG
ncbi:glycosyltransferase [Vibrio hippocampi]|uniref:N-acetylgalactosamine-N, N'-diacetylbacillosaminyl-diphospho-undecaprenol 4-alpha-N-acetylgalactosaminyltransferase n=1 Tax=Vibrio hippocampi TaxID=654686 RepID=A0ABN8DL59_9VIBR|nr:glycosyltransferase [Vibrio hippocampi]CAH0529056.1 N-acetylgalactosamine-N, N'-diacetylbacillosaminyl-diphospho-undecaprenol 4-alpha-N-acetylgalactosaminyltransferase [Vibrio hippocampi]